MINFRKKYFSLLANFTQGCQILEEIFPKNS